MIRVSKLSSLVFGPSQGRSSESEKQLETMPGKILTAFHAACDTCDVEIADRLLRIFEAAIFGEEKNRIAGRQTMDSLVAARERVWQLRQSS